jgi:transcription antitermination factor NusG
MASLSVNTTSSAQSARLPSSYWEPLWYAAYTSANHEKRVAVQFAARSVEHFLPMYESIRRWKDRRVKLQLPLFPGYVFVRLALRDTMQVLQVPSVVRLVGFNGVPATLAEEEVESLRRTLLEGVRVEPHPFLRIGHRVRITAGPLAGREGILKRWKGDLRVVLSSELIQRSIMVDIDASAVEPVRERPGASPASATMFRTNRFKVEHTE